MDFSRSSQPQPVTPGGQSSVPTSNTSRKNNKSEDSKWARIGLIAGIVAVVILLLGLVALTATGKTEAGADEQKLVDSSKLQAVFLSTGQVYFGNIKELNSRYFVVDNIYYLQTSSTDTANQNAANTSVSLVKLGCELHSPFDKMVINRAQVTFWENLQDDGQVAKAVKTFKDENPDGQKCSDTGADASTTNNVQGSGAGANTSTTNNAATGTQQTNR